MLSNKNHFEIGQRIESENRKGTIKYVGPLKHVKKELEDEEKDNIWIGVEWDEKEKGKHNGTVEGFCYFQTQDTRGSLLRPEKLNLGISFLQALNQKYNPSISFEKEISQDDLVLKNEKGESSKTIELVGLKKVEDKLKEISHLERISLDYYRVSSIDSNLQQTCPNLIDVDISNNLITSFQMILELGIQLPRLQSLNISHNFLQIDSNSIPNLSTNNPPFPKLKILVMNACNLTWKNVYFIFSFQLFPQLQELHIGENSITKIEEVAPNFFSALELLNLQINLLSDWNDILKFGKLAKLEKLLLNENKIAKLSKIPEGEETTSFMNLTSISISHNLIESYQDIDSFNSFPKLSSLRLNNNPFEANQPQSTVRQLIIARIPKLEQLNGSSISKTERFDSEKFYLRYCVNLGLDIDSENFKALHPRFFELEKKIGRPVQEKKQTETIAQEMISLLFISETGESMEKKIPLSITISNLKILCQRQFKIDVSSQLLLYKESASSTSIPVELDSNSQTLFYYGVKEKGQILVKTK